MRKSDIIELGGKTYILYRDTALDGKTYCRVKVVERDGNEYQYRFYFKTKRAARIHLMVEAEKEAKR